MLQVNAGIKLQLFPLQLAQMEKSTTAKHRDANAQQNIPSGLGLTAKDAKQEASGILNPIHALNVLMDTIIIVH